MIMSVASVSSMINTLNSEQKQAVLHQQGPVLVLAGAGSGKTRVLTHKIAYAIEQGTHPAEILAVTFTNKAAKEMNLRIQALLPPAMATGLWVGTFHSICGRILRYEIDRYSTPTGKTWSRSFVIYDESNSISAAKEAIKTLGLDEKLYVPKQLRYQISSLKSQLLSPYQFASQAKDFKNERLAQIYDLYETILNRNNALDFDDLLLKTVELLQNNPDIRDRYHKQFQHVLVDEFQDTNDAQYEIVRLFVEGCSQAERVAVVNTPGFWNKRSFTVVGDVDQSIYSWRGANFKIILNFQHDYPQGELIKLETNYRSSETILKLANSIIENNSERLPKVLKSHKGIGEKAICYEAKDDRDEAFYIIDQFQALVREKNYLPSQCCILYRTNSQSRSFEDILMTRGLAYTIVGGLKFYERREIKDVMAYLTILFNEQDAYSIKRVINVPKRSIGKASVEKIEAFASREGLSLYEALLRVDQISELGGKAQKAVGQFMATILDLKKQSQTLSLDQLILYLAEATGYTAELKTEDPTDSEGRIQNIEEFVSVASQYLMDTIDGDLGGFLTTMALLSDIDSAELAENKFLLMTMHASKGLEYPVVAISGLEEGLFPHSRSLSDTSQMEEERRLMYVGVTRAEDLLMMTYCRRRMTFGEFRYATPSRFLKEAPSELLSGMYTLDSEPSSYGGGSSGGFSSRSSGYTTRGTGGGYELPKTSGYSSSRFVEDDHDYRPRQAAKQSSKPMASVPIKLLAVGTRVGHLKFGDGVIHQVIGENEKAVYSIQFDTIAGKKLLDPRLAKLEILD
jgi:DNA helicase II / ATP-dependent DNA helicase PcrA